MKKHRQQQDAKGFSQFARPFLPQQGGPKVIVSQTHGNTAVAVNPTSTPVNPTTTTHAVSPSTPGNSGNPYESIVTRNVFGLNPIPPYQPPPQQEGPPPPKITLTGIMTIFGPTQALFKVAGVVRGNARPQDESYILTEGQEQDDVVVTKIDVKKQIVTFTNHGVQQDIPLVDSGLTSSGPAPSAPSWPGQNGIRRFGRFPRFGGGNNPGFQPQTFGQPQPYNNSYNYNSQSSGNGFGTQSSQNSAYNPSAQSVNAGLSGEDEAALIAAQHAQLQQNGNPMSAIMPPTKFDPEAGVGPEPGAEPPASSAQR